MSKVENKQYVSKWLTLKRLKIEKLLFHWLPTNIYIKIFFKNVKDIKMTPINVSVFKIRVNMRQFSGKKESLINANVD